MNYALPPPLKAGDTIGIMAPSSRVSAEDVEAGKEWLEQKGYQVYVHPQTFGQHGQSAGTHDQKIAALHELVSDPKIHTVIFAGGGNRALHILDNIDYGLIAATPKIYMGFSDCTAVLNAITAKSGIITYHGPVLKRIPSNAQMDFNLSLLQQQIRTIPLSSASAIKQGSAEGILAGGNLSLIRAMNESDLPDLNGAILFLEDVNEEFSKIERDFCALRRSGMLDKISALILGGFTGLTDTGAIPFDMSLEDIVRENTAGLDIPVIMGAPFGHDKSQLYAFPIGAKAKLEKDTLTLMI